MAACGELGSARHTGINRWLAFWHDRRRPRRPKLSNSITVAVICAILGACTTVDSKDIGTELYDKSTINNTDLLAAYVDAICIQASLPSCNYGQMSTSEWNAFVQMGIFDIDRRCDAYLQWLYQANRSREAVVKVLGDTADLVDDILTITDVSAKPIRIVAAAFGFASSAYSSISSALLLEMDKSTVFSVVLGKQREMKVQIAELKIATKPAALNTLRSYMRLCMPQNIEADINSMLTASSRGGGVTSELVEVKDTIAGATLAGSVPATSDSPVNKQSKGSNLISGAISEYEKEIEIGDGKRIQLALCVEDDGKFGSMNSNTRKAIRQAKLAGTFVSRDIVLPDDEKNLKTINNSSEAGFLLGGSSLLCNAHENNFERYLLPQSQNILEFEQNLKALLSDPARLNAIGQLSDADKMALTDAAAELKPSSDLKDARQALRTLQQKINLILPPDKKVETKGEIEFDFYQHFEGLR